MKVVINTDWGGFGLSDAAIIRYAELADIKLTAVLTEYGNDFYKNATVSDDSFFDAHDISRNDPFLVQVVEELGEDANGCNADLKVVEIPDGIEWHIHDYDGIEHVAENHRTWR